MAVQPDSKLLTAATSDVAKNRRELLKTVVFPGTPTRHDPESTVR